MMDLKRACAGGAAAPGNGGPASPFDARRPCIAPLAVGLFLAGLLTGCEPTVKVEAPDKPIVINLNVKIEQEVRVKIDHEVDDLLKKNPDLF